MAGSQCLKHDPEKCEAAFPRDKRRGGLRGDHAYSKNQSAMIIRPNRIVLQASPDMGQLTVNNEHVAPVGRTGFS
jgi:hypothetical protein